MTVSNFVSPAQWTFIEARRVARFASVEVSGRPHVLPVCYATDRKAIYSILDEKPKRVPDARLRRVENIRAHPEVTFLVDDYTEDWERLAWVLVRGHADIMTSSDPEHDAALSLLRAKYPRYRVMALSDRSIIRVTPTRATAWSWTPDLLKNREEHPERHLDLMAIMRGRRSVRAFRPDPVPRDLVERVLEAGRWAPSPHGRMPWRFVVLTSDASKLRLAQAMGIDWERQLAMDGEPPAIVADRLARSHERVLTAPVLVLVCLYLADLDSYPDPERQLAETTMAIHSLGAATQNMLLAAYDAGLDGGWMCAPLFCQGTVRQALDLSPDLHPHALLPLGYPARDPKRRPRRLIDEIVVAWL